MSAKNLLILDIGSTYLKSTIYQASYLENDGRPDGDFPVPLLKIIGTTRAKTPTLHSSKDEFEIDPYTLVENILKLLKDNLQEHSVCWHEISCIGITSQRNTFVTWDASTGKAYHRLISWKDKRASSLAEQWNASLLSGLVRFVGGCILTFYAWNRAVIMSAIYFRAGHVFPRLAWLKNTQEHFADLLLDRNTRFGLLDTWLLWKLTKGQSFKSDISSVSSTGMFSPATQRWSRPLIWFFQIPRHILPEVVDTVASFGSIWAENLDEGIPVTAMVADQQAAAFGHFLTEPGQFKLTLGTGAFLDVHFGSRLHFDNEKDIYTLIGWRLPGQEPVKILETQVENYGAIVSWCLENNIIFNQMVTFPPDILNCPFFVEDRFSFVPKSRSDISLKEKTFSVLEVIATKIVQRVKLLSKIIPLQYPLKVDGGLSCSNALMQILAALLNERVSRSQNHDLTSFGTALLAALGAGIFNQKDLHKIASSVTCDVFEPDPNLVKILSKRQIISCDFTARF